MTHVGLSTRRRNLFDIRDTDLQRLSQAVVDGHQHLGVLIDEDQQHTAFVTEQGRLVTTQEMARLLMEVQMRANSAAQFVLAKSWLEQAQGWLTGRDAIAIDGGETASELVGCLNRHEASLALSGDGRVWFRGAYPNCDAILVLAQVLQALSLSDAPFSTVINRISPNARH